MTPLPDVFLPYQQALWAAIDANQAVVAEKSRRTGYSWTAAAIAATRAAAARSAGGCDVLYMGYEKEMTREFIDYVGEFAKLFQLAAGAVEEFVFRDPEHPERDIGAFRIRFASGFEVVALPSLARALRGKQGLVILDEAAFMDDLGEVLKAALALLIWGGKVVVISTHDGEQNPFNALVQDVRAGRAPYALLRLTFGEAVQQGLYRRVCLRLGHAWTAEGEREWVAGILARYRDNADEELHVIPNPTSGTFLPGPLIAARMDDGVPVLRFEQTPEFSMLPERARAGEAALWMDEQLDPVLAALDADTPHAFGYDIARRGDASVIWLLAIGRDLVARTALVLEMRNIPFSEQRALLWRVRQKMPRPRGGAIDATGLGMQLAEESIDKWGGAITAVMMSEPWYRANMPPLKAAFEDAMLTVPRDRDIESDLRSLKLVRGVARVPERVRDDRQRQRHGDAAIALALAYAASRAEPEEYGYEAAPRRPVSEGGYSATARDEEEDRREDAGWMGVRGVAHG